jgi:hypothetical protein
MNENEIRMALRNLESRLATALNNAQAAQDDLNRVRMLGSLPPIQYFHLSAAVAPEAPTGPRAAVRLSAHEQETTSEFIVLSGVVRRGEAIDLAAARKLLAEKDKRR